MKVLVDTSVWSTSLRRRFVRESMAVPAELAGLIEDGRALVIGAIRQELLSGVKERAQFNKLRDHLRAFPDAEVTTADYEKASEFYNRCREKGFHGSNTDFLICAVAVRPKCAIFTLDTDFTRFANLVPIALHPVP